MQHSSYSAAIRQIFDRINQRESGSQLRLHFVLPIANLVKKREGRRRMRREKMEEEEFCKDKWEPDKAKGQVRGREEGSSGRKLQIWKQIKDYVVFKS